MRVKTNLDLFCGAIAGPLFTVAWCVEGYTRADYSALRHPISSLAIGELGWTQTAAFLASGLLTLGFAIGLQRVLPSRRGLPWAPLLIGAVALGLIGAGIFVADPLNGYPPGTLDVPVRYTTPGYLHRLFSALYFLGLPVACFVLARRFSRRGNSRWAIYSAGTGLAFLAALVLTTAAFAQVEDLVDFAGLFQRIAVTIGWAWLTLLAIHLLKSSRGSSRRMAGPG